jgi:hypothetical protein
MALSKLLTAVCLGSTGEALREAALLLIATASNSCRENIGLSKLSLDSTLYPTVVEKWIFFLSSALSTLF